MNLGALNIPDGTFPLIKAITLERLKAMIAADTVPKVGLKHDIEFGACLVSTNSFFLYNTVQSFCLMIYVHFI